MAKKIAFVGLYVIIFMVSLLFGHTLKSYAAPARGAKVTSEEFKRESSRDLEQLGKLGIHTSVRSNDEIVEMRFHCVDGKSDWIIDAGDASLLVNNSTVFVNTDSRLVTYCGVDNWDGNYGIHHRKLEDAFPEYNF